MIIRFLGTHSAESINTRLVCLVIDDILAVDAGSLTSELSFEEQESIRAILLSHGHYDHIRAVPAFAFNNYHHTTNVFATQQTLEILESHLVDGVIYPRFTGKSSFLKKPALKLCPLEPFKPHDIEGYRVLAMPVNHPIETVSFEITSRDGKRIMFATDTGSGLSTLWEYVSPNLLIVDMNYPNKLEAVARDAGHLCPRMLMVELVEFRRVKGYLPRVILIHLSPKLESEIRAEVVEIAKELGGLIEIAVEGQQLSV